MVGVNPTWCGYRYSLCLQREVLLALGCCFSCCCRCCFSCRCRCRCRCCCCCCYDCHPAVVLLQGWCFDATFRTAAALEGGRRKAGRKAGQQRRQLLLTQSLTCMLRLSLQLLQSKKKRMPSRVDTELKTTTAGCLW